MAKTMTTKKAEKPAFSPRASKNVKTKRVSGNAGNGKSSSKARGAGSPKGPAAPIVGRKENMWALERVSKYASDVLDGTIVAGPHVRNSCRRHFSDLERGGERGLSFNVDHAAHVMNFFESALTLSEGQFEGIPFKLHTSQSFKLGSLFGWKITLPNGVTRRRFRRYYGEEGKGNGKALSLSTPVVTPSGWSTMGDLQPGDFVIGSNGRPTQVVGVSEVMTNHECFEVVFDDGEKIVADADHLWVTDKRKNALDGRKGPQAGVSLAKARDWRHGVRTTREIAETLRYKNGAYLSANHSVPLASALELDFMDLAIEPYTLGAWLGDGDSDSARITSHDDDAPETMENIACDGYHVGDAVRGSSSNASRYRIYGIQSALRGLGVLHNKHIPSAYLRASLSQRMDLLHGLMDTDGTISKRGQCEFTSCVEELANGFLELVTSLGFKATIKASDAKLSGRKTSTRYRIMFYPGNVPAFRMARKLARQGVPHDRARLAGERRIVDCRPVESVPVRCIKVSAEDSLFLAGRGMVPTHNSPFAGGIGLYGLMADDEAGSQVYAAAAKKEQAQILFQDACKMVRRSPKLAKRLKFSGSIGKEFNIAHHDSGSFFRPISKESGKSGSGPRPYFALCDEVHEHPDRAIMEMLERGFKARLNPLLLMITNSGSDRTSICWEEHENAVQVAAGTRTPDEVFSYVGEPLDDTLFSYVCALDKGDDPLRDPSCWIKANPMLGVILSHDYIEGVVTQAINMPGKRNGILRLHFCQWTDAATGWMGRELIDSAMAEFNPWEVHAGAKAAVGIDLSASRDLTAMAFAVETGTKEVQRLDEHGEVEEVSILPTFDVWCDAWSPADTLQARSDVDKAPYVLWSQTMHAGSQDPYLRTAPGTRIRYDHVAHHLVKANEILDIIGVAYDRYAYDKFKEECDNRGLQVQHVAHPQGGKVRARVEPEKIETAKLNGEEPPLGLWMPGSVKLLEDAVLDGRIRFRLNPALIWAFMGAAFGEDPQGNKWFVKGKTTVRIDMAVAVAMAIGLIHDGPVVKKEKAYQMLII